DHVYVAMAPAIDTVISFAGARSRRHMAGADFFVHDNAEQPFLSVLHIRPRRGRVPLGALGNCDDRSFLSFAALDCQPRPAYACDQIVALSQSRAVGAGEHRRVRSETAFYALGISGRHELSSRLLG